jgi:hypothetical protein
MEWLLLFGIHSKKNSLQFRDGLKVGRSRLMPTTAQVLARTAQRPADKGGFAVGKRKSG